MKTGTRLWQLVGLVAFILVTNGILELYDAVKAKEKQLESQFQLLAKQQALLLDNRWSADLAAVGRVRQAWLMYLPAEPSVAGAKASLLYNMRSLARDAGMANLSITANEVEDNENRSATSGSGYVNNAVTTHSFVSGRNQVAADALPGGIGLIKVKIGGRFDPVAFAKLLHALEKESPFTVVERVSVRGLQMELNLRCYWRLNAEKPTTTRDVVDVHPKVNGY